MRTRFQTLLVMTLIGVGFLPGLVDAQPTRQPRNIVFIFTDDQWFDGLSSRNDYFETLRLDRLVEGGVLFEKTFVTTSLCSPSRASILFGLHAHTH